MVMLTIGLLLGSIVTGSVPGIPLSEPPATGSMMHGWIQP